jgi:adenine deaminase
MIRTDPEPSVGAFIKALPKTETHLHIEGALPFELIHAERPEDFPTPPASWTPDFRFRDFSHFEGELLQMAAWFHNSPERYYQSASLIFKRLKEEQNVRYVETSFASGVLEFMGVDGRRTAEAIACAGKECGLHTRVFLGIHHNGWNERTQGFLEDALHWEHLTGFDLHGTESLPFEEWTPWLWNEAREIGKFNKAHAGEFMGPEFIRLVLDRLQVNRLEHGVRAVEDPSLVSALARDGITLDVCPISNVKLGVVESMEQHPVRQLSASGVRCTISTDDPISFGNTLFDEYAALACHHGATPVELAAYARNGFQVALIDSSLRKDLLQEIDVLLTHDKTL